MVRTRGYRKCFPGSQAGAMTTRGSAVRRNNAGFQLDFDFHKQIIEIADNQSIAEILHNGVVVTQ